MKKIVYSLLTAGLLATSEFRKEVEQAFLKFDADNNGLVTED